MLVSNKRRVFVRPLKSAFKLTNKHDFISLQLEQYRRQACTWLSLFWCCSFVRDLRGNRISRIAEGTFEKLFSLEKLWVFNLCRVSEWVFSIARNFFTFSVFCAVFLCPQWNTLAIFRRLNTIVVVITCNTFSHPSKTIDNTFYPFLGY